MGKKAEAFQAKVMKHLAAIDNQVQFEQDFSRSCVRHVVLLKKMTDSLMEDLLAVADMILDDRAIVVAADGSGVAVPMGMSREDAIAILTKAEVACEDGEEQARKVCTTYSIITAEAEQA